MNGWSELIFHNGENSGKLGMNLIIFGCCDQKWAWDSNFNECMNLAEFLHANTYLRKLKVTLIIIGWAWWNMGVSL